MEKQTEFKFPSEEIELPSKGVLYDKSSPLSSGKIELKYMTAREEDILTNTNYIEKGTVIDRLIESLILNKDIKIDDLLIGDKNAILIAARIMGYGKDYEFQYRGESHMVDLSTLTMKYLEGDVPEESVNEFPYTLPNTKVPITFRLLTHGDEKRIEEEIKQMKRIKKDASPELSTRMKYIITSVNGNRNPTFISRFVEDGLLARDSRELRKHIQEIQPDVNLKFFPEDGPEGGVDIPIGVTFFWPDAGV